MVKVVVPIARCDLCSRRGATRLLDSGDARNFSRPVWQEIQYLPRLGPVNHLAFLAIARDGSAKTSSRAWNFSRPVWQEIQYLPRLGPVNHLAFLAIARDG